MFMLYDIIYIYIYDILYTLPKPINKPFTVQTNKLCSSLYVLQVTIFNVKNERFRNSYPLTERNNSLLSPDIVY